MKVARRRLVGGIAAVAAAAMIMMPGAAFAKGGPPPGKGHGGGAGHGGGGGGGSTVPNNLSVPTIMVAGGGFTGVNCPDGAPADLVTPDGTPLSGYPIDPAAYYYVQGVNAWQAQCYSAASALVTAAWGSNLTGGEAKLSVGKPIRVELGLYNNGPAPEGVPTMDGYAVEKLNPDALDRESAYGTLATGTPTTGFSATPKEFGPTEWRVYAAGAKFSICLTGTSTCAVPAGTDATAEINATGNVVYGYNLRVSTAGFYTITFTIPAVTFPDGTDTVSLEIEVTTGSGGGGGGGHG